MSSFTNIKIPSPPLTVEEFIIKQRTYTPEKVIELINDRLVYWLSTIRNFNAKHVHKINIIDLCYGYTLDEVKELTKLLIDSYIGKGYIILYTVKYKKEREYVYGTSDPAEMYIKIKSISFKTKPVNIPAAVKPNLQIDRPPAYELVPNAQNRRSFLSRVFSRNSKEITTPSKSYQMDSL